MLKRCMIRKVVMQSFCYECVRIEKDQSFNFNQFTVNISEFTAYWLKLVNDLVEIWLRSDSASFFFSSIF